MDEDFKNHCESFVKLHDLEALYWDIKDNSTYDHSKLVNATQATLFLSERKAKHSEEAGRDCSLLAHTLDLLQDPENQKYITKMKLLQIVFHLHRINSKSYSPNCPHSGMYL